MHLATPSCCLSIRAGHWFYFFSITIYATQKLLTVRIEPHLEVLNIHILVDTAELLWPFNRLKVSFVSLCKERSYCNALFTSITHRNLLSINDYEKVAEYLMHFFLVQLFSILLEGVQI